MGKKFSVILADPPWTWISYSDKGKGKSPEKHYNTMTLDDLKNLPVKDVTDDVAGLYLWVPDCNLLHGLAVMDSWGFEYKSIVFIWYKTKKNWRQVFKAFFGGLDLTHFDWKKLDIGNLLFRIGLGYHSRKQTEICLYGTTKLPPKRKNKGVRQVISAPEDGIIEDEIEDDMRENGGMITEEIFAPIGKHSAKPKEQYPRIEALVDGPYLELFARETQEGWMALGNEIDGLDIRDALNNLISARVPADATTVVEVLSRHNKELAYLLEPQVR